MIFINFLELNFLDTHRPIEERQNLGNITFLRPEEVYIQDPCQLYLLSVSQM